MSVKNILGKPKFITGVGYIYPIKVKDYEEFTDYAKILYVSKKHFESVPEDYKLLDLIIFNCVHLGYKNQDDFIRNVSRLFEIVTNEEVSFFYDSKSYGFMIGKDGLIDSKNYEDIRSILMNQNIIFEQKVYKTKIMNEWAEKVMKVKQKNAPNITFEDIISTVSVGCSKNYWDLENYTIYQLYSDYYRFRKIQDYETSVQFKCVGGDIKLSDYSENLDLYHNPYDDLFISQDKLTGINKIVNG